MNLAVIGCGRWGSFLAWYLASLGHAVRLYGRENSANMRRLLETRGNGLLTLPDTVELTTSLRKATEPDTLVISVGSQGLRALMEEIRLTGARKKTYVLCMKGLENGTGKRLSEIVLDYADTASETAVWLGPGHVQEFVAGIPNCMVIDSRSEAVKHRLVEAFSGELIRFYYGDDLLGNEIGAAAKNVIGIAAGMLDGLSLTSLKGALMSRGTREIARLIEAMGGNPLSAYGLCHLGDYEATVFSPYSHNRQFGESFVVGRAYGELAEGFHTVIPLTDLGEACHVDLPICRSVRSILYDGEEPREALRRLFLRSLKNEWHAIPLS